MEENHSEHRLLGNGYRLDLVSLPGAIVLRREEDGSEVARFSIRDATSKSVEEAAQEDYRTRRKNLLATDPTTRCV
jgi:hypothetical protein